MIALYETLEEMFAAEDKVAAIDHPIRCTVHDDDDPYVCDILPLSCNSDGVYGVLLHDGPNGTEPGCIFVIDYLDFQVMTWEEIEVDDFDWKPYLEWKKKKKK